MRHAGVAVVGAATAGFAAAAAARLAGAPHVVILEKASPREAGGNARFSHAGFRFPYAGAEEIRAFLPDHASADLDAVVVPPYTEAELLADIDRLSGGEAEPEMSRALAAGANEAVHWMRRIGIRWSLNNVVRGIDGRLHVAPGMALQAGGGTGGGVRQLEDWARIAAGLGIRIHHDTALVGIGRRADGSFSLQVQAADGRRDVLTATDVVLASGGFQASAARRAERLGPGAEHLAVRGSRHDTGEVLDLALALGASRSGEWGGANVSPVDGDVGGLELGNRANRYSYPFGITVDVRGERFFDEGEGDHAFTYATAGWALARQPEGRGHQIFDGTALPLLKHYAYQHAAPAVADTIAGLARLIGVPAHALEETVAGFNAAVPGTPAFDPGRPDGRSTRGLVIPKSNWAMRIETPPFHAYSVRGGITFTYGGLRVDRHARVLDDGSAPIDGLYATGDILGIFARSYPSGAGQTRNAVFGLAAGRHIGSRHGVSQLDV